MRKPTKEELRCNNRIVASTVPTNDLEIAEETNVTGEVTATATPVYGPEEEPTRVAANIYVDDLTMIM